MSVAGPSQGANCSPSAGGAAVKAASVGAHNRTAGLTALGASVGPP